MSKNFWHLKETESFDEAFDALKKNGLSHAVDFFIESCEDKTWIKGGGDEFMGMVFRWLLQEYREARLSDAEAKAIAKAIQKQFDALQSVLDYDVDFVIEGKVIAIISFMYEAQSPFFKELIRRAKPKKERKTIEMQKVKLTFFDYIKEFVYKAQIEFLWREEPKYILNFIRQAIKLGMAEMAAFASEVYKRYLTPKNVIPHLQLAQREFLKDLENECCQYVNEQNFGLHIKYQENVGLEVSLDSLTSTGLVILDFLAKQISYLTCKNSVAESFEIVDVLRKIPRLVGLGLSNTSGISEGFLENFPKVKQLKLSHCLWLSDDYFLAIVEKCPGLVKLDLSKNTELSFRSFGALTSLSRLTSLNLSYCDQLNDDDFDLVASSCPELAELHLQFCRISDEGLKTIAGWCRGLKVIDLTDCKNITEEGIEELQSTLPALEIRFSGLNV